MFVPTALAMGVLAENRSQSYLKKLHENTILS